MINCDEKYELLKTGWYSVHLCDVVFTREDLEKPHLEKITSLKVELECADNPLITVGISLKDNALSFFTENGDIARIGYGNLSEAMFYQGVIKHMRENPDKVSYTGSIVLADVLKCYEIEARHNRPFLDDEQFNAIYLEILQGESYKIPERDSLWVSGIIAKLRGNPIPSFSGDFEKCSDIELEILRNNRLDQPSRVEKQVLANQKDGDLSLNYGKYNEAYLKELIAASQDHCAPRSEIQLIRDALLGENLGSNQENLSDVSVFNKIFAKSDKSDTSLEF